MKAIWITLAIAASLSTVACGGGGCAGSCKDASKCDDAGDDFDTDACEESCEEQKDAAEDLDCGKEYDDALKCIDVCDLEGSAEDCADEATAFNDCLAEGA